MNSTIMLFAHNYEIKLDEVIKIKFQKTTENVFAIESGI